MPAEFAAPPSTMEADLSITPDRKRLYYISTRHDPKNEDFDIWVVERRPDGAWSVSDAEVMELYRQRWQIELLRKFLKVHLN